MNDASEGTRHGLSAVLHRRPRLRLGLLIGPPMLWLGVAYLGALGALFITAFWGQNPFTGDVVREWTLDNFRLLYESEVYRKIAFRTLGIAALVTVVDIVIAFPVALYMAKIASPRMQRILVIAVLTPLWASYLVKAYAWRIMMSEGGIVSDLGGLLGLDTPGYGLTATVITLAYLWLPFMILPIYSGLERLPDSLLEASMDLGARTGQTMRRVVIPAVFPAVIAGSIFTFSLSLGDYITDPHRRWCQPDARQRRLRQRRRRQQPAVRRRRRDDPGRDHAGLPGGCQARRGIGEHLMTMSPAFRMTLRILTVLALVIIYVPLLLVVLNSFNASQTFAWPPTDLTFKWWHRAADSDGARSAVVLSIKVASLAAAVALVLGTMAAMALQRYRFFGRDTVSLLIILPIALPGIVTGIALNNAFRTVFGWELGFLTIVIAHATFCIVTVFNNVLARLRRLGVNLEEASADLGASTFTTFRLITFPMMRSALLAGGLLAFALSFDEIIVTTFTAGAQQQTLPIWIFNNLFRPNQGPVVNVIAVVLILASVIPIWISQKLAGSTDGLAGR